MPPYPTNRQARRALLLAIVISPFIAVAGCKTGPRRPGPITEPVVPTLPPGQIPQNRVAVIVPLTGSDGPVGTSLANAANLALADSGENSLKITVYDSTIPGGAAAATSRAIAEGNRLILGPLLSEDVRAAAPVARKAGVPVISFSNDEGVAGDGVYIIGFTPNQSIMRAVTYAKSRGATRFAGLVPTGLYGQRAAQALLVAVRDGGGRVTSVESFNRTAGAAATAARRLNAKGSYDALLIGDSGRIAALIAPSVKVGTRVIGTELWASDKALGKTAALRGAWYATAPDTQFARLVTRYRARYGKTPYRLASLGYDAVLLAVRSSRNWPIGRPFPARSLIDKDGFGGVDGNFRFGRDGVAERLLEVRQVTATGTTTVSPAATAF
jgi:ABC-type branched-subunit amino acid transport system substrate-binding protein